jgi:hypothetical protein
MDEKTLELFRKWGRMGGKKAKHSLTSERAKKMVAAREKKRKKRKGR